MDDNPYILIKVVGLVKYVYGVAVQEMLDILRLKVNNVKVIKRVGHLPKPTVVYEWQCPPNCPECARVRVEPVLSTTYHAEGERHDEWDAKWEKLENARRSKSLMGNIFCEKCNRWGDHDETANHGD